MQNGNRNYDITFPSTPTIGGKVTSPWSNAIASQKVSVTQLTHCTYRIAKYRKPLISFSLGLDREKMKEEQFTYAAKEIKRAQNEMAKLFPTPFGATVRLLVYPSQYNG